MRAFTGPVMRWDEAELSEVVARAELAAAGITPAVARAHVRARRWQLLGRAFVLHNGPISRVQREQAALISCGPRAVLTSFTAAARWGLTGWDRDEVHVLVPAGTRPPALPWVVVHRVVDWPGADIVPSRRLHRVGPAVILAAAGVEQPRYACAVVATSVQQRLVTVPVLHAALDGWPKLRHCRALRLALHDIGQGAQALSEIDFVRLCRRFRLPPPDHQAVRVEPDGRRRYLDAHWRRRDGSLLAEEVDGAIHLAPRIWMADQLRQNEVVIGGTPVLRFPSPVVRCAPDLVADQLRRGLQLSA
jgi:hypothetical protein